MGDMLTGPLGASATLRALLAEPAPLIAPGAYDALSARLVEQAGFDAVYLTGFGTSASQIGRPDVGLLSGSEMVDQARRLVDAVDRPVIADADTGYGNAINVIRTVRAYEQAGVAAMQLEDQVMPKKCGHMSGKAVLPVGEMVGKIRAAVEARRDPDLVLIARTDAAAVHGLDDAIARARAFERGRHQPRRRGAARRRTTGLQLGRGRPHATDLAGADHRARLLPGALPHRHAARCDVRRARGPADDPHRRDPARGDGRPAHLRGVHRPDRASGGADTGAALRGLTPAPASAPGPCRCRPAG